VTEAHSEPTHVVIVDDHDLVREGLRTVLSQHADMLVVGEAGTVDDAVAVVHSNQPDLVLLDLRLADQNGVEVARRLRAEHSSVKVLVLSVHDSARHLREALAAGADGYLLKSVKGDVLVDGIRKAVAGETVIGEEFVPKLLADAALSGGDLTPREQQVLELVAEGLNNRAIAEELGTSLRTVHKHVERLLSKLGVADRTEAVAQAFRRGLLG
jgi:DNA-binding NarL/FixJ family response regulator